MDAAQPFRTKVLGTRVGIVAVQLDSTAALAVDATVAYGANVPIVAATLRWSVNAAIAWIAAIRSTNVAVITGQGSGSLAGPATTMVTDGAWISIITVGGIGDKLAAAVRVALIVGATVTIEAGQLPATSAFPQLAVIASGTEVAIVTRGTIELVDTT